MRHQVDMTIFDIKDVSELTRPILRKCLQEAKISGAKKIADCYFDNLDHGHSHSQAVWDRCQAIIKESPNLWPMAKMQIKLSDGDQEAKQVLMLAAIFHDMGRFLGASFEDHEQVGANLSIKITVGTCLADPLYYAIVNHDYICPLVDGDDRPRSTMFPLSEIFRLADKTSISPSAEIQRYHLTGRRLAPDMPLYDPTVSDEIRFQLSKNIVKSDELTWFLIIFALQSTDFIYGDIRDAYAYWARGKFKALEMVGDLCLVEEYGNGQTPVDPEEAKQVIIRFCKQNNLILFS